MIHSCAFPSPKHRHALHRSDALVPVRVEIRYAANLPVVVQVGDVAGRTTNPAAPLAADSNHVELGNDDEGDPITSRIIIPSEITTRKRRSYPPKPSARLSSCRNWSRIPACRPRTTGPTSAIRRTKQKAFCLAVERLQDAYLVGIWGEFASRTGRTDKELQWRKCNTASFLASSVPVHRYIPPFTTATLIHSSRIRTQPSVCVGARSPTIGGVPRCVHWSLH